MGPGKFALMVPGLTTIATAARAVPGAKRTPRGAPNDHNIVVMLNAIETTFCSDAFFIFFISLLIAANVS